MTGKEKCEMLKALRREIAVMNMIDLPPSPVCTYQGPCPGYCEVCDKEKRELEQHLKKLEAAGRQVQYLLDYKKLINDFPRMSSYSKEAHIREKLNNIERIIHFVRNKRSEQYCSPSSPEYKYLLKFEDDLQVYKNVFMEEAQRIRRDETMGMVEAHPQPGFVEMTMRLKMEKELNNILEEQMNQPPTEVKEGAEK